MTAGSGVIVALSVWHESRSVRVTAVHFSCYELLHALYFIKFLEMVLFGSQTRAILTITLFTAFRNCLVQIWNTSPMLFFRLSSVRGLFLYSRALKLQNVPVQIWHTRKPQSGLCCHQKHCVQGYRIVCNVHCCTALLKKRCVISLVICVMLKMVAQHV